MPTSVEVIDLAIENETHRVSGPHTEFVVLKRNGAILEHKESGDTICSQVVVEIVFSSVRSKG